MPSSSTLASGSPLASRRTPGAKRAPFTVGMSSRELSMLPAPFESATTFAGSPVLAAMPWSESAVAPITT